MIRLKLGHIRALLVLDNVDQVEQRKKLAVSSECLGARIRIIIISRDVHILKEYEVNEIANYFVKMLSKVVKLKVTMRS